MKPNHLLAIAIGALGAVTVQALHAQTNPPVYYVAEVDVTDLEGYRHLPKPSADVPLPPDRRSRRSKALRPNVVS
jgi:hypothetical protein